MDPVTRGRVQVIDVGDTDAAQAQSIIAEFQRIASHDPEWDWSTCAVIAKEWGFLDPVRSLCELEGIPVQMANEDFSGFWHLRETRSLIDYVRERESRLVKCGLLDDWCDEQPAGPWNEMLRDAIDEYELETGGAEMPADHFVEWLAEWGREARGRQRGVVAVDRTSGQRA